MANRLQKVNQILTQEIAYFTADAARLETDGLLRVQGNDNLVNPIAVQMLDDPLAKPLSSFKEIQNEPNDVIGVFKKAVKDPAGFSPEAIEVIAKLLVEDNTLTSDGIIQALIAQNALEEAKMLHNMLHLGFLVAQKQEKNRMIPSNVAVVLGPWIANITDNPMMGFNSQLKVNLTHFIEKALKDKDNKLTQSFDNAYPEQAKILQESYKQSPKTPSSETSKPSGNIIARFFKAIWNGIKSIFSGGSKAKKEDKELLISAPKDFKKVTEGSQDLDISQAQVKSKQAQVSSEPERELPSHLVKREKPVAHHHAHHRKKAKGPGSEVSQELAGLLKPKGSDKPKKT